MSINNKLVKFASQDLILARTSAERDKINNSLSHLEKVLKNSMRSEIESFIRFGSYTRNTILPRKYDVRSDVDLMVIFNTSRGRLTAETYRSKIAIVLNQAYPNSISKKDYPAVKLELNHIKFDIVPAYVQTSVWMSSLVYSIPNKNSGWQTTYPNDINQALSTKNQQYGNNTIRNVIRLCKHWNAMAGYPLESYAMEKDIINLSYWGNENTYERFLKTLNSIAGNREGVRQALDHIKKYQGDWFTAADQVKELQWVKKLLPGLT